jgi:hypothetical protein
MTDRSQTAGGAGPERARRTPETLASGPALASGQATADAPVTFDVVFEHERRIISERRQKRAGERGAPAVESHTPANAAAESEQPQAEIFDLVGVSLSGGGIRSAAFCLGALQALDVAKVFGRVDYMSTVSGGGYIGTAVSACMEQTRDEKFPFPSLLQEDEPPPLQHLRDHSNYLFLHKFSDMFRSVAIYLRGLVANALLILPFLLLIAALTAWLYAARSDRGNIEFIYTGYAAIVFVIALAAWGIAQSFAPRAMEIVRVHLPFIVLATKWIAVLAFSLLLLTALLEVQFLALDGIVAGQSRGVFAVALDWINSLVVLLAPLGVVLAFLSRTLGDVIKSGSESARTRKQLAGVAAAAAMYFAALIVPLVLWVIYLNLTYWSLCIDRPPALVCQLTGRFWSILGRGEISGAVSFYLVASALLLLLAALLRPNANSLHPLYRDRLGKAFLFTPEAVLANRDELAFPNPPLKLTDISGQHGPYHLINAAINLQGSKVANKRGRNADFFMLSSSYIGSEATKYVKTRTIEADDSGLDLAAAMAISGAAASSNMGGKSIKTLTPTLAILNIRLGYWLHNPAKLTVRYWKRLLFGSFYFLWEAFGQLNEKRSLVYITDGGHIENLGIYELLRRRCKVIIAVDAEADREMAFGSFNDMQRYALIDLGVRIDLPWQQIADVALEAGREIDEKGDTAKRRGPHCAIGEISYPDNAKGVLVYIKSSITGDENDFVFHYKKRHSAYPQENTIDQFFSEEQFEAYRTLGFHCAFKLFNREDAFAYLDSSDRMDRLLEQLDTLFPHRPQGGATATKFADVFATMRKQAEEAEKAKSQPTKVTVVCERCETATDVQPEKPRPPRKPTARRGRTAPSESA